MNCILNLAHTRRCCDWGRTSTGKRQRRSFTQCNMMSDDEGRVEWVDWKVNSMLSLDGRRWQRGRGKWGNILFGNFQISMKFEMKCCARLGKFHTHECFFTLRFGLITQNFSQFYWWHFLQFIYSELLHENHSINRTINSEASHLSDLVWTLSRCVSVTGDHDGLFRWNKIGLSHTMGRPLHIAWGRLFKDCCGVCKVFKFHWLISLIGRDRDAHAATAVDFQRPRAYFIQCRIIE